MSSKSYHELQQMFNVTDDMDVDNDDSDIITHQTGEEGQFVNSSNINSNSHLR